jgi:hypothetical protein
MGDERREPKVAQSFTRITSFLLVKLIFDIIFSAASSIYFYTSPASLCTTAKHPIMGVSLPLHAPRFVPAIRSS